MSSSPPSPSSPNPPHRPTPPTPPTPNAQAGAAGGAALDRSSIELALSTLQDRLDQLQQSLTQQNKLATLGMITAVIAHEFNNILTPMIAYTKFALTDKADEALRTKALAKALAGGERLANISKSLLGFTRGDESPQANIAVAVRETLACLSRDLSKDGITLKLEVAEELAVQMNAGQFQQVLMNLIVNARSAMLSPQSRAPSIYAGSAGETRSRSQVEATRRPPATPTHPSTSGSGLSKRLTIEARLTKIGEAVEISISDTGPGIPAEVLPRIFDPFFTTKRRGEAVLSDADAQNSLPEDALPRGGTGLGLTICQELISAAGGTIRAASEPGMGAVFVIELPASRAKAPQV